MATFSKKQLLMASPSQIPQIEEAIRNEFEYDGFEIKIDSLMSGGSDISLTKGNIFKAVLGLRSALKIKLVPQSNGILFDASVGIFGQQVIPAVVAYFVFWPVLLTQIWGIVQQSKLDDRALAAAQRAIQGNNTTASQSAHATCFCPACGCRVDSNAKFCPYCGSKIQ